MRKPFIIVLVALLLVGVFVSCKMEEEKTEVGTWVFHSSAEGIVSDETLILRKDGSAKNTLSSVEVVEGVTTTMNAEMNGTYKKTSDNKGTITFTSGSGTSTTGNVTITIKMPDTTTRNYEFSGGYLIVDGDIFTRK